MSRHLMVAVVAAVLGAVAADVVAGERVFAPPVKVPPGFVHCRTPDGPMKVKNKPKLNIFFVAIAPGHEAESFRFTAFKRTKKLVRIVEVGIDAMPFASLSYPVDVPAEKILAFAYSRRDAKTGAITASWEMDGNSSVHVTLKGFNAAKRRLWGEFSAEDLHDTFGGNGPIAVSNGVFNLRQSLPPSTK